MNNQFVLSCEIERPDSLFRSPLYWQHLDVYNQFIELEVVSTTTVLTVVVRNISRPEAHVLDSRTKPLSSVLDFYLVKQLYCDLLRVGVDHQEPIISQRIMQYRSSLWPFVTNPIHLVAHAMLPTVCWYSLAAGGVMPKQWFEQVGYAAWSEDESDQEYLTFRVFYSLDVGDKAEMFAAKFKVALEAIIAIIAGCDLGAHLTIDHWNTLIQEPLIDINPDNEPWRHYAHPNLNS